MRILVLTDRFIPEITAPSFRVMDHARVWLRMGHSVTVVTCVPNFPHGRIFSGYSNRWYQEEWMDGIRIVRVWSFVSANEGVVRRTLDYFSFMCSACFFFWRYPAFDVILATSPPLLVPIAGYVVSKLRGRPWVFEIRDLWPDTIRAVGVAKGRVLSWLERLELFLYEKADGIISLTQSFKLNLTRRRIDPSKIYVITNGVDTDFFSLDNVKRDVRNDLGIDEDAFLAGYIGTVGMCHGLETLIEAAKLCLADTKIKFILVGEGSERRRLENVSKQRQIDNILFHDFVQHEEVPSWLAALDVFIVHLRPDPLFETVIPSKMFESMAMGVPMIFAVPGESSRIVMDSGSGLCIPPGDPQTMADAVMRLHNTRETLVQMRQRGRLAVEQHYSRKVKAEEVVTSLEAAVQRKRDP